MKSTDPPVFTPTLGGRFADEDDSGLDYLSMPQGMSTYRPPPLPEPEQIARDSRVRSLLARLLAGVQAYRVGDNPVSTDITDLDPADRELLDQTLGEGEVSIVVAAGHRARIQESVLAGVWRVQHLDRQGAVCRQTIEVADVPELAREYAGTSAVGGLDIGEPPPGAVNARALLAEITDKSAKYQAGDPAHVINLTLLPVTEQDLEFLAGSLGAGPVTMLSRGYGNCRLTSTALANVWWVQYYNSTDRLILNTLEVVDVPQAARAAQEDLEDSAARLAQILEVLA